MIIKCHQPLLLLLASSMVVVVVRGVEIVGTSPSQVMVRQGESLDLYCDSNTPYQVRPLIGPDTSRHCALIS